MRRAPLLILCLCICALSIPLQRRTASAAAPAPSNPCATQLQSFKLTIAQAGIYELTAAALTKAGWSGTPNLNTIHIYHGACATANELAIDRSAGSLRFYAEPSASRYSAESVYWLRSEARAGVQMTTRAATPASAALQSTAVLTASGVLASAPGYDTYYPGADGDHFFAINMSAGETVPVTFTLSSPVAGDARLLLAMQGETSNTHRLDLRFDQNPLARQTWAGEAPTTLDVALGTAALAAGTHVLQLSIPDDGGIDAALLDTALLRYPATLRATSDQLIFDGVAGARRYSVGGWGGAAPLLYDLRAPLTPVRLTGASASSGSVVWQDAPAQPGRYALLSAAQLLSPAIARDTPSQLAQGSADYLIVGYGAFLPATAPLASYYRSQGMRVATVDVQDVYDEFGGGELSPEALRSFLRYAYAQWTRPAPTYVLLVGDGSYDFRNRMGLGWANYLPPYLANVDPWMNEAACDPCYARVQSDDPRAQPLPDLRVGRLPVGRLADAQTVVSKTLGYLQSPPAGGWRSTALLLADNYREPYGETDSAGDFAAVADTVAATLPPGTATARFYYDPTLWPDISKAPRNEPPRYGDPAALQQALFSSFDQGAALVAYVGHANFWQWGYTEANVEPSWLWYLYDADARTNGGRLPILLTLSCLTGFFHEPNYPTTDERLLTHAGGGIVASFSPAGKGVLSGHDTFSLAVLRSLYSADPKQRSLGAAQMAGFQALQASGQHLDLTFTYTLLGDPALHLPFVPTSWSYLPLVRR